jgi:hypothetical protein
MGPPDQCNGPSGKSRANVQAQGSRSRQSWRPSEDDYSFGRLFGVVLGVVLESSGAEGLMWPVLFSGVEETTPIGAAPGAEGSFAGGSAGLNALGSFPLVRAAGTGGEP